MNRNLTSLRITANNLLSIGFAAAKFQPSEGYSIRYIRSRRHFVAVLHNRSVARGDASVARNANDVGLEHNALGHWPNLARASCPRVASTREQEERREGHENSRQHYISDRASGRHGTDQPSLRGGYRQNVLS